MSRLRKSSLIECCWSEQTIFAKSVVQRDRTTVFAGLGVDEQQRKGIADHTNNSFLSTKLLLPRSKTTVLNITPYGSIDGLTFSSRITTTTGRKKLVYGIPARVWHCQNHDDEKRTNFLVHGVMLSAWGLFLFRAARLAFEALFHPTFAQPLPNPLFRKRGAAMQKRAESRRAARCGRWFVRGLIAWLAFGAGKAHGKGKSVVGRF